MEQLDEIFFRSFGLENEMKILTVVRSLKDASDSLNILLDSLKQLIKTKRISVVKFAELAGKTCEYGKEFTRHAERAAGYVTLNISFPKELIEEAADLIDEYTIFFDNITSATRITTLESVN